MLSSLPRWSSRTAGGSAGAAGVSSQRVAVTTFGATGPGPPHADDGELALAMVYGDRSTISLATGRPQPLRRAPAVATAITADDIAAMGATDFDEVLATVPGLHVARNNQANTPLYLVRACVPD
jgi:outer membrane receptor for ferrienterochelin and colicin